MARADRMALGVAYLNERRSALRFRPRPCRLAATEETSCRVGGTEEAVPKEEARPETATLVITEEDSRNLATLKDMFGVEEDQAAMHAALDLTRELVRRSAIGDVILIQQDDGSRRELELRTRNFTPDELEALAQ